MNEGENKQKSRLSLSFLLNPSTADPSSNSADSLSDEVSSDTNLQSAISEEYIALIPSPSGDIAQNAHYVQAESPPALKRRYVPHSDNDVPAMQDTIPMSPQMRPLSQTSFSLYVPTVDACNIMQPAVSKPVDYNELVAKIGNKWHCQIDECDKAYIQ